MTYIGGPHFALEKFAYRQFDDASYSGSRILHDKEDFIRRVNDMKDVQLVEGYASFCKHIFIPNFTKSVAGSMEIAGSEEYIKCGYVKRREEELPVLSRWLELPASRYQSLPPAKYLDLILYSREQVVKENVAMGLVEKETQIEGMPLWFVISIKAQDEDHEVPMTPITMMRNVLISEGGSGEPIDREKYGQAVKYWSDHAIIMSTSDT